MFGESQRGHFRPCSGGLAAAVFRLPAEPWFSSFVMGFAGMLSCDIIALAIAKERKRAMSERKKKNLDVGVVLFWSVSFGRGKDTKLNGFMHGGEKW